MDDQHLTMNDSYMGFDQNLKTAIIIPAEETMIPKDQSEHSAIPFLRGSGVSPRSASIHARRGKTQLPHQF